jgi:hypothetical protein
MAASLAVAGVQLVSAYVVLGRPDVGAAREFLTGTSPTMTGSVAAAQLVLWAALLVAVLAILVAVVSGAVTMIGSAPRRPMWSLAVVLVGLVILAVGAAHRLGSASDTISGGSLQEAGQLAR